MANTDVVLIARSDRLRKVMATHIGKLGCGVTDLADGVAAARHMARNCPDVLVIDDDVPMGARRTAQLLRLHPDFQHLPALILAKAEEEAPADASQGDDPAITVLAKPCSGKALQEAMEGARRLSLPRLSVNEMRRYLESVARLPTIGEAHRKILSLLSNEDEQVDIPEVVRTIEADPGLTTSVLRVCRAAYYGFRGNTIELAITFLGVDKIRSIVQSAIVFNVFTALRRKTDDDDFTPLDLWKHSVACGIVMEEGGRQVKGRDHFIAGMLHDIGKLIIYLRFPDHFAEVRRMVTQEGMRMYDAELSLLGVTHAEIGYELARRWELPPTISTAIAFHHHPSAALQHRRLSSLVHTADVLCQVMGIGSGGDEKPPVMDEGAKAIARYVARVVNDKDDIAQRVESMVVEYHQN